MPGYEDVKSGKLDLIGCAKTQTNIQARYIAGVEFKEPITDEELLERARHNLFFEFAAFGLSERFNESLTLFSREFDWNIGAFSKANVTGSRPKREDISPDQTEVTRACCLVDVALYGLAVEEFDRRVASQHSSFQCGSCAVGADAPSGRDGT